MPKRIHRLFCELMLQADQMDPESVIYEIEDLQDKLLSCCTADTQIVLLKKVYNTLAKAKQSFRRKI